MRKQPDLFELTTTLESPTGPTGMSDDLLREVLAARAKLVHKMVTGGCKNMDSYADAVGGYRQLDFVLGHSQRKADAARKALGPLVENEEEYLPQN